MENQPMRPKEIAERWQCSAKAVIRLIQSGKLTAFDIGSGSRHRYLVSAAEVSRYEKGRVEQQPVLRRPRARKLTRHFR